MMRFSVKQKELKVGRGGRRNLRAIHLRAKIVNGGGIKKVGCRPPRTHQENGGAQRLTERRKNINDTKGVNYSFGGARWCRAAV